MARRQPLWYVSSVGSPLPTCEVRMPRAFATLTLLATLTSIAPQSASGQLAPPRRPFLFKDDRGDVATAHARGDTAVTVIIAAMPGATGQLVQTIQAMGGTIRFR